MPFLVLKTGPFFLFFCFIVFKNLILPAERRGFFKKKKKTNKQKTTFLALKTGPILLRNILGPVFNASLDQFLTLGFLFFFVFFFFFLLAETPIFIVFSAKNAKFKETQKRKKDTICKHTCANCSCQNVLFLCIFHFWVFLQFPIFQRCFLIGSQNSKKYKI